MASDWVDIESLLNGGISSQADFGSDEGDLDGVPDKHTITIRNRYLTVDYPELVQNNINTDTVELDLDTEWDGVSPFIIFTPVGSDPVQVAYLGSPVIIPSQVMANSGSVDVSVAGYGADGVTRLVTVKATAVFSVVESGSYVGSDIEPEEAEDILSQLLAAATSANQAAESANALADQLGDISEAVTASQQFASVAENAKTQAVNAATASNQAAQAASEFSETASTKATEASDSAQNALASKGAAEEAAEVAITASDSVLAALKNIPKKTSTGYVVHGDDAYSQKPLEMIIKGRTINNLIPRFETRSNAYMLCVMNEDGSVDVSSIQPASSSSTKLSFSSSSKPLVVRSGGTYKLKVFSLPSPIKLVINSYDSDGTMLTRPFPIISTTGEYTGTIPSGMASTLIYFYLYSGEEANGTVRVMLTDANTTIDTFLPPGIHSVQPENVRVTGKNLITEEVCQNIASNSNNKVSYNNGVFTATVNDDRSWSLVSSSLKVCPETYTVSASFNTTSTIQFGTKEDGVIQTINDIDTSCLLEFPNLKSLSFKFISRGENPQFPITYNNVQLELGSTATAYEPPVDKTFALPEDITLNGIGNYSDELVISEDGSCEIQRYVDHVLVDGTDLNANLNNYESGGWQYYSVDVDYDWISGSPAFGCVSDRFFTNWSVGGLYMQGNKVTGKCCLIFTFPLDTFANIGEAHAWFQTNPTNVWFTPGYQISNETLTDVQTPLLPAPEFNVYHDADIPSDTTVTYARDINMVLANLEAIQTAMLGGDA